MTSKETARQFLEVHKAQFAELMAKSSQRARQVQDDLRSRNPDYRRIYGFGHDEYSDGFFEASRDEIAQLRDDNPDFDRIFSMAYGVAEHHAEEADEIAREERDAFYADEPEDDDTVQIYRSAEYE